MINNDSLSWMMVSKCYFMLRNKRYANIEKIYTKIIDTVVAKIESFVSLWLESHKSVICKLHISLAVIDSCVGMNMFFILFAWIFILLTKIFSLQYIRYITKNLLYQTLTVFDVKVNILFSNIKAWNNLERNLNA